MFGLPPHFDLLARGVLLTALALGATIFVVRVVGLRSFSKMTPFDFVVTIATGSLLAKAGTVQEWSVFGQTLVALVTLFACQYALAHARRRSPLASRILENAPRLLFWNGTFDQDAMAACRVRREDVIAKLREANVASWDSVRAVVLEATGDISVLHGEPLDEDLLTPVRKPDGWKA